MSVNKLSKESFFNEAAIDRVVMPYVSAVHQLQKLSKLGPVQHDNDTITLAQKYNVVVKGFESQTSRKNFVYAIKLLDEAHAKEVANDRGLKPEDRKSHEPLLYKSELFANMGRMDDVESLLLDEICRLEDEGELAHAKIFLMLAAVYINENSFQEAIELLKDVNSYEEFRDVEHAPGQNASRMLELAKAHSERYVTQELKRCMAI